MRNVWAAALLAACLTGCAYQCNTRPRDLDLGAMGITAVVPFDNLSGRDAGVIVAELFHAQLDASGKLELVPPEVVAAALGNQPPQTSKTRELGKLLGAKTLVIGRVTEYQYKHTLGEDPAVGLSVRVVDAETGKVLWSGARSDTGRIPWFKQDGLSRKTQDICGELACTFFHYAKKRDKDQPKAGEKEPVQNKPDAGGNGDYENK